MMKRNLLLAAVLLGGSALAVTALAGASDPQVPPWGVELKYLDTTVKPGNDFFAYANGGWLKTAEIPAARTYSGVNLELDLQNEARLKTIVAELATRKDLSPEEQKLSDLYNAYMDQKQIEAGGLKPAQADLTTSHR
jgi:predicted metalloendopeptidase